MKKIKKPLIIVIIIISVLIIRFIITSSSYYKLKTLYIHPIKQNQKYNDYVYDEYINHICILFYEGEEKEVIIPERINGKKVESIDDSAFYGNEKMEKVIIPKYVIRIGHQSFIGNNNLKEVYLPNNIYDIGPYSFDVCTNLEKIYIKKNSKTEKSLKKTKFYIYKEYK